jgi:hypothetical protein
MIKRDTTIKVPAELVERTEKALDTYGDVDAMLDVVSAVLNRYRTLIENQQAVEIFGGTDATNTD